MIYGLLIHEYYSKGCRGCVRLLLLSCGWDANAFCIVPKYLKGLLKDVLNHNILEFP